MGLKIFLLAFLIVSPVLGAPQAQLGFKTSDVLEKLVETVKDTIKDTVEQLNDAYVNIIKGIEEQFINGEKELLELSKNILTEIPKLEQEAAQLDKDAADCIKAQKEKVQQLNQDTIAKLHECVEDVIADLTNLFGELVESLNEINNELLALMEEFEACPNWSCKGSVGKKIAEEILKVNTVMGDKITRFLAIIRENRQEVQVCIGTNISIYRTEVTKIAEELKECLNQ